jgi:hypothetical protein
MLERERSTMELIEIAFFVGVILFATILGYESDKSRKVFWEIQIKLKNRLKDWKI